MAESRSGYLAALPGQLVRMGIYLAILAGLHFTGYLVIRPTLRWTLVAIIIIAAFVPRQFSSLASGVGFLVVAGVAYFGVGSFDLLTVLCIVFGVWSLIDAVSDLRRGRTAA